MKQDLGCVDDKKFSEIKHINSFNLSDDRGSLTKLYSSEFLKQYGIDFEAKEVLIIFSNKNVLRGIHYQRVKEVDKLIKCRSGEVLLVAVDLRQMSVMLGQSCIYMMKRGDEIYIPKGFGIATLALEDSELFCMYGEDYYEDYSTGIVWNDSDLGIAWPMKDVIISDKDKKLLSFKEYIKLYFSDR